MVAASASASGEWLDSRGHASRRLRGALPKSRGESDSRTGLAAPGWLPAPLRAGRHPSAGRIRVVRARRWSAVMDWDPRGSYPPARGGPAEERSASEVQSRAVREARSRGFGGAPRADGRDGPCRGVGDGLGPRVDAGTGEAGRRRGVEPGESGRIATEALGDYEGWRNADRGAVATRSRTARRIGTDWRIGETSARGPKPGAEPRRIPEGFDPREGIRPLQAAFPVPGPAVESLAEERATPVLARVEAGASPGGRDADARIGGGSTGVIERLLREQNELIKQDVQRNANPPIAAPPPMRGGGIRM